MSDLRSRATIGLTLLGLFAWHPDARAADPSAAPTPLPAANNPSPTPTPTPTPPPPPPPPSDEPDNLHFRVDPVADGALIVMGLGFAGTNELILSTGEIRPQQPGDPSRLLGIDHGAISQSIDPNANTVSNIGLYIAVGFAVLDPILSGARDGWDAALVDGVLYAETMSLTLALTDVAKLAVRRPRPRAYIEQAKLDAQYGADKAPLIADTDSSLSFFSGHAAMVAATSATATYLAFSRSPNSWRPWVTLAAGVFLTSGVSFERVRAGAHFPTDVIAGAIAGAGIGVLVPHLHRHASAPNVWVGVAPTSGTGGSVTLQGLF